MIILFYSIWERNVYTANPRRGWGPWGWGVKGGCGHGRKSKTSDHQGKGPLIVNQKVVELGVTGGVELSM